MSFPFFRIMKNTIYSDTSLDKTLTIVYNVFTRRSPVKNGEGWFFYTLRGACARTRCHKLSRIKKQKKGKDYEAY